MPSLERRLAVHALGRCRGLVTAILVGEGTGFRDGTEAALVVPSANKEKDLPRFRPPERKTLLLLV